MDIIFEILMFVWVLSLTLLVTISEHGNRRMHESNLELWRLWYEKVWGNKDVEGGDDKCS